MGLHPIASRFVAALTAVILLSGVMLTACKKQNDPTFAEDPPPKPTSTFTKTPTLTVSPTVTLPDCAIGTSPTCTPTNTPLPSATPTATLAVWCPGPGGDSGQSWRNVLAQGLAGYSFYVRIQLSAAVSITGVRVFNGNYGMAQQLAVYSDDGTGTRPASRLCLAPYTDNSTGWVTIDVPDVPVGAGYAWLAVSAASAADTPYFGACSSCGAVDAYASGIMPVSYSTGFAAGIAPSLIAEWACQ